MDNQTQPVISGAQLVADFQAAFINATTATAAKAEAERSEIEVMQQLNGAANGGLLQPGNLNPDWQAGITRESVDAHIKKAQATQLDALNAVQLAQMTEADNHAYHGRRVTVRVQVPVDQPVEAVWFDKYTGYRNTPYKTKSISGTISEVLLDRNALVIKPTFARRTLIQNLKFFVVYVVHPATAQPMVEILL